MIKMRRELQTLIDVGGLGGASYQQGGGDGVRDGVGRVIVIVRTRLFVMFMMKMRGEL